jgi:hypothetical protein
MALDTFTWLKTVISVTAKVVLPSSYNPGSADSQRFVTVGEEWKFSETLRADNSPSPAPVAILAKELTLASSEATIDLTAAAIQGAESGGAPAASEDLTGKNLIAVFLSTERASGTNAGAITAKAHTTNGYDLFGASGLVVMPPGAVLGFRCETAGRDPVGATDKIIHFTGTTGDTIRVILVFEA